MYTDLNIGFNLIFISIFYFNSVILISWFNLLVAIYFHNSFHCNLLFLRVVFSKEITFKNLDLLYVYIRIVIKRWLSTDLSIGITTHYYYYYHAIQFS